MSVKCCEMLATINSVRLNHSCLPDSIAGASQPHQTPDIVQFSVLRAQTRLAVRLGCFISSPSSKNFKT